MRCVLPPCVHMVRVFVYGTLKRGQPNYHRMFDVANGKAEFVSSARTVQRFPLIIATEFNIPFMLNVPGEGQRVRGEIYEVDEAMLRFLDAFESVPTMYQRTLVELEVEGGGRTEVFIYNTTTYQPEWRSLPCYESYDSEGDHGLEYVAREAR